MTGVEREDLKITLEFLREWRDDDRAWKAATDKRLGKVEQRLVIEDAVKDHTAAVASEVRDSAARAQLSARWRIGLVLGISTSALVGIANILLRINGH